MSPIKRPSLGSARARLASASGHAKTSQTFVLGLGAQKAGTTWLSNHLKSSPEYENGYRKEYHVFDSRYLKSEEWLRRNIVKLAAQSLEAILAGETGDAQVLHRMAMYSNHDIYFEYFRSLLSRSGGVTATGDLTPDYGMLPADRLALIKAGFAKRDIRTVGVFIMRDPVERVWSHMRMKADRSPANAAAGSLDDLRDNHGRGKYWHRTQYQLTLTAMDSAFSPDEQHVGLYEDLFSSTAQADAITKLVGIRTPPPDTTRVFNSSPRDAQGIPEEIAKVVAARYAEVYRAVAYLRPDLHVERWWPHSKYVL
ncbi:MAG: sulfotransferase [Beijerinckiaceae bacterium]|nr:sulfotransferase [Beijerinckiaceae bacterium]